MKNDKDANGIKDVVTLTKSAGTGENSEVYTTATPSMPSLSDLRVIMYDILQGDEDNGDANISLSQQMGINMSKAVQKDGVNIIQMPMQQVVDRRITLKVIDALKLMDAMAAPKQIEFDDDEAKPGSMQDFLIKSLEVGTALVDFLRDMEKMYVRMAVKEYGMAQAKGILNIREPRIKGVL